MNYYWREKTKVAIWGTGKIGRLVREKIKNYYDICLFVDSYVKGFIDDLPIISPVLIEKNKYKIIVAIEESGEIIKYLEENGYILGENYLPYKIAQFDILPITYLKSDFCSFPNFDGVSNRLKEICNTRKLVSVNGNCQTGILAHFLAHNEEFLRKYVVTDFPQIFDINEKNIDLICEVMAMSDIIVTQVISENNKFSSKLSTHSLKEKFKDKRIITIANFYFDGYWPQMITTNVYNKYIQKGLRWGAFPDGDMILDELSKKYTYEEVVEIIKSDIFSREFMQYVVKCRFDDLRKREEVIDIGIADYLELNYKNRCCFYTLSHPKNFLIEELARRLLEFLGISNAVFFDKKNIPELSLLEDWIYPSVYKALELKFEKKDFITIVDGTLNFEDACRSYLRVCHHSD